MSSTNKSRKSASASDSPNDMGLSAGILERRETCNWQLLPPPPTDTFLPYNHSTRDRSKVEDLATRMFRRLVAPARPAGGEMDIMGGGWFCDS